jgi:hypothetical protein
MAMYILNPDMEQLAEQMKNAAKAKRTKTKAKASVYKKKRNRRVLSKGVRG